MESLQFARGKESNAFSSSSSSSVCHEMQKSIQLEKLSFNELSDYSQRPQNRDRLGWDRHKDSIEARSQVALDAEEELGDDSEEDKYGSQDSENAGE